jgi:hypothetical protein
MARKSKALALLRTVYNATDRSMQWRSLEGLDVPETAEALRYAVEGAGSWCGTGTACASQKPAGD